MYWIRNSSYLWMVVHLIRYLEHRFDEPGGVSLGIEGEEPYDCVPFQSKAPPLRTDRSGGFESWHVRTK